MDPLGLGSGELSFYAYAANQRTMVFDPTGLSSYGCAFCSSLAKTVFGGLEIVSGAGMVCVGVGGTLPSGGASLALTAFGGAVMLGGIHDLFTGGAGLGINGGAFIADRAGLISDTDRCYVDAVSDALDPSVAGVLVSLSNSVYWLSLTTCSNQWLQGTQQVAWLHFTAASNQSSAFVRLSLDNITGFQSDGTPVLNFASQSGRVVIVGQKPLLEALPSASNQVVLLQYALRGYTIALEWTTNLPPAGWQQSTAVLQTNLVQDRAVVSPSSPSSFFRAVRQ